MMQLQHQETPDENTLSWEEREELRICEGKITEGLFYWRQTGEALRTIRDKRLYRAYGTFDRYLKAKWELVRSTAYQIMKDCELAEEILKKMSTRVDILATDPASILPEQRTVLRPLGALPREEQADAYLDAFVENEHNPPNARKMQETVRAAAPTAEQATSSRIGNLEVDRKAKPTTSPTSKKVFGYIEADSVQTSTRDRRLTFTYFRPAFTTFQGKPVKAQKVEGLAIPFRILESQGWTPPVLTDEERELYEPDDDKPISLLEGRDLSQVRRKPQTTVGTDALTLMLPAEEEDAPVQSFTANMDFTDMDALAKPFEDYAQ